MSRMEFAFCAVRQGGCQSAGELIQIPTQKVESLPGGLSGSLRTLISLAVLEPWPQLAWEAGNVHFSKGGHLPA